MNNWKTPKDWSSIDLEKRKRWYANLGQSYDQTRPNYDFQLIQRLVTVANLTSNDQLLEIGCGTGKATVEFAKLNLSLLCLEPNFEFLAIAQHNCQVYPHIQFKLTSFEEWQPDDQLFDGVIAANAFHWIPAEISYPKTAYLLKTDGRLILLWNLSFQLPWEIYQELKPIYQQFAPQLDRYETPERQEEVIKELGQSISNSGLFHKIETEGIPQKVTYSIEDYLTFLSTTSPYIGLSPQQRLNLLSELRDKLKVLSDGTIPLTYLSAFQIAQKI